ncbi:pntB [Symbiodinium pilosum]|uniref:PntB protein n=1 Tax=Symbiodinium pilosum TaxID=2952 RepID=A0A812NSY5_SYMPI|nr:pntB [Symbiodinium pilosum]
MAAAVAHPDLGSFPSRSSSRCSRGFAISAHPKAAEEVADLRPAAVAHLHKLHSRLRGGGGKDAKAMNAMDVRGQRFRVDNGFLRADSKGLGFRRTKDLQDMIPGALALWGSCVAGIDEGDGWLRVGARFLPMFVGGIPVLSPEAAGSWSCDTLPSPASPSSLKSGSSAGAFISETETRLAPQLPLQPRERPLPWPHPGMGCQPTLAMALPMTQGLWDFGAGICALPTPCRLSSQPASPDFRALFRELVSLLKKCRKKVARGSHPSKELIALESLQRAVAEEAQRGSCGASWHYLLQELTLTRQALEGSGSLPEGILGHSLHSGILSSPAPLAAPSPAASPEVAQSTERADSEFEEPSLVAELLAEASRAGDDAEAAAAVAEVASRPRLSPRRSPRPQRPQRAHSYSPGARPSLQIARPLSIEDRCSELESCVARSQKARAERQRMGWHS